ncbi:ABC transporter ATP-binding protein [Phototrophicus methaneseepsis]|uniref:ABC transporter ATP-binding protein n=1 Tax=Phototrophicus methaneseepsis TaxID=2710758 RepID=A0A7S8EAY3_9CHLR|nr:ABC transporter ATP-binding protein [Phototrophicus methaneseepsis]QPC83468.1 ABC transporter ATP-binding protein [Phototrophicus methaneseepsis]
MIEVENLTKRYGDVTVVNNISFTAEPGQVTGFLGPNGAGKTTTMRMLTGFSPPTAGKAVVAGHDVFQESLEVRKRVGYLPENVPLYRDMSARGYLMYIAEIRGLAKRRQRADEVLDRVGLLQRANSRIRTLSKGMKQRVGLAAALIHNPDVLILDEPTIGLDPFQVLELRGLVQELGRDHTVLFSTHILSEAERVCDKVVIINQGQIIAQGSPSELRSRLERGARVLVRVEGDSAAMLDTIRAVDGVSNVSRELGGFIVTPRTGAPDPRAGIVEAIVAAGVNLLEVRPLAVDLEDIFIELTRQASLSEARHAAEQQEALKAALRENQPKENQSHEEEAQA